MSGLAVDGFENRFGALFQQVLGHPHAQRLGFRQWRPPLGAQQLGAIRLADQAAQPQLVALADGVAGDRHLATAVESLVQRALGSDPQSRIGMVQGFQQGMQVAVGSTTFDADGALSTGGQAVVDIDRGADARG